jgi:hypothetical protein
MPDMLTCISGHQWNAHTRVGLASSCPVCGDPPLAQEINEDLAPGHSACGVRWASVELGPPVPLPVFTSGEAWNPDRIRALAIYCSDGRWGEAFDEFCHRHLLIPRYDRLALPGGPAWLVAEGVRQAGSRTIHGQLDFLVRAHGLERIVLIAHYGCAYYAELLSQDADGCLPSQIEETLKAVETLTKWFPGLRVEAYLAMRSGTCLSFNRLEEGVS